MLDGIRECWAENRQEGLSEEDISAVLDRLLSQVVDRRRILLVPPDITRLYSYGGILTRECWRRLSKQAEVRIMPATGTHRPMTRQERREFFGEDIPEDCFLEHDWQKDTVKLGTVPAEFVRQVSENRCDIDVDVEVNRSLVDGTYDLILSIGQVVPHEVVGMANYSKNILVGLGGRQMINKSHMIGAVCNLERIMGRRDTPVRAIFDYGESHFLKDVPLVYILTVVDSRRRLSGIYAGSSRTPFERAAALSEEENITCLEKRVHKVVAYLEPEEFSSTWVGNKAIYRTRMIVEDGGELLILAPGLRCFGENEEADRLIRAWGYRGTPYTMKLRKEGKFDGADRVAAHIIHSSSEGRFSITLATDSRYMTKEEVESVGYAHMEYEDALRRYPVHQMEDGYHQMEDGEEIYVVKAPALGLWKTKGA